MIGKKLRRMHNSLDWRIDTDEPLIWLATYHGLQWMQREYIHKKRIKGGLLNKSCGILTELIFRAMLDELKVPHVATEPIFDKKHNVNIEKIYDFRLSDGRTIDVKTLPPGSHNKALNLNQNEAKNNGVCDYYAVFECKGMYSEHEFADMQALDKKSEELGEKLWGNEVEHKNVLEDFRQVKTKMEEYLRRIKIIRFVAYAEGTALVKSQNLKDGLYGPYYSLKLSDTLKPPFHSYQEFADSVLHATIS